MKTENDNQVICPLVHAMQFTAVLEYRYRWYNDKVGFSMTDTADSSPNILHVPSLSYTVRVFIVLFVIW